MMYVLEDGAARQHETTETSEEVHGWSAESCCNKRCYRLRDEEDLEKNLHLLKKKSDAKLRMEICCVTAAKMKTQPTTKWLK